MSYAEFAEYLWDHTYTYMNLADEQYWDGGFKAETWLKVTEREAAKREIKLSDLDSFDYEDAFYSMYETSEKGLS